MLYRALERSSRVLLVASLVLCPVVAQNKTLRIGTITDGPWDRDQRVLATFRSRITETLAPTHQVHFDVEKQLNGDWTIKGAKAALNRLLSDPEVDVIVTLGLVSSYEAATRTALDKPVIATRVIAPDLLKIPARQAGGERVSGVPNLSYITVEGIDLVHKMGLYRRIAPFSRVTFLMLESLKDLLPRVEAEIATELAPLNLSEVRVVFVGDSPTPALRALTPGVEAVVLTPLPQLEPAEHRRLLETLLELGLPTFGLGTREDIALGVMAGVTAPREVEVLANRTAHNIKRIVGGHDAADLPVNLPVQETLAVNTEVASALGITLGQGATADAQPTADAEADRASPSMATVNKDAPMLRRPDERAEEIRRREERLFREVQKRISRLSSYTAFDAVSFSVRDHKVTLLGYAWRPVLKKDVERAVERIEGVEVESHIEVLSSSSFDDRIRARAYLAIYGHPSLRKYAPGGGFSRFDLRRALSDLRFGLAGVQQVKGPHAIHIIVKNGNVALVGVVNSRVDRQIVETQVRALSGVFSVENHLQSRRDG